MIDQLIESMLSEYETLADQDYRALVRDRYQMDVSNFLGVRTPAIRKVANRYFKAIKPLNISLRLDACEALLEKHIYELKIAAFQWAHRCRDEFQADHLPVLTNWLDTYVDDWIDGDDFCIHVLGEFFVRFPELATQVIEWTESPNRWMRRGSAVSLILPARQGRQLTLVFQVADKLMADDDHLVVKAYGWMLKEVSKRNPEAVFDYVLEHRKVMPRVAYRYAIEKLPEEMRRKAMSASG